METVEIYRKPNDAAKAKNENVEKELEYLSREIESIKTWQEYYKTSGLTGQASLCEQKAKNLRRKILLIKEGIPYPTIVKEQWEVLSSVFNRCVPAEEFSFQSMPPEVVEAYLVANEYKEVGIFDSIEVAYYDDDPILIGRSVSDATGYKRHFLIARWGDGLKPWEWFTNRFNNEKRAHIPFLRLPIILIIASILLLTSCFLFPLYGSIKSFLSTVGVAFIAVSAGLLFERFKLQKSYSRYLNEPIPSPFTTQ